MKRCAKCLQEKDEKDDFYWDKRRDQPHCWCKVCLNAYNRARVLANPVAANTRAQAWRDKNPERVRKNALANYYRDPERSRRNRIWTCFRIEFKEYWDAQKGLCACCGEPMLPEGQEPESVCVDHDRACCSGKKSCGKCVRGLIHWKCNLVLGYAHDDLKVLRGAVSYLEGWAVRKA
jgi:hypothetical protein